MRVKTGRGGDARASKSGGRAREVGVQNSFLFFFATRLASPPKHHAHRPALARPPACYALPPCARERGEGGRGRRRGEERRQRRPGHPRAASPCLPRSSPLLCSPPSHSQVARLAGLRVNALAVGDKVSEGERESSANWGGVGPPPAPPPPRFAGSPPPTCPLVQRWAYKEQAGEKGEGGTGAKGEGGVARESPSRGRRRGVAGASRRRKTHHPPPPPPPPPPHPHPPAPF